MLALKIVIRFGCSKGFVHFFNLIIVRHSTLNSIGNASGARHFVLFLHFLVIFFFPCKFAAVLVVVIIGIADELFITVVIVIVIVVVIIEFTEVLVIVVIPSAHYRCFILLL